MIVLREGKFEDFEFYYNIKSEKSSVYWGDLIQNQVMKNFKSTIEN